MWYHNNCVCNRMEAEAAPDSSQPANSPDSPTTPPKPGRVYDKEKRRAHKQRRRARALAAHFDDLNGVLSRLEELDLRPSFQCLCAETEGPRVDWATLPELCDPVRYGKPDECPHHHDR